MFILLKILYGTVRKPKRRYFHGQVREEAASVYSKDMNQSSKCDLTDGSTMTVGHVLLPRFRKSPRLYPPSVPPRQ